MVKIKYLKINIIIIVTIIFLSFILGTGITAAKAETEAIELDEMVVTASKYEENYLDVPALVETVTAAEIEAENVSDLAELLRNKLGLTYDYSSRNGTKEFKLRGANTNQVLVLLDGQSINSGKSNKVNLARFPIEIIEKVEILKGSASALYGANAVGGVINIITKKASLEPMTTIKYKFGSYNSQEYLLSHSNQSGKLAYSLIYSDLKTDGFQAEDSPILDNKLDEQNIFTKFNYQYNPQTAITASIKLNEAETGVNKDILSEPDHSSQDFNLNLKLKRNFDQSDYQIMVYHNNNENIGYEDLNEDNKNHETNSLGLSFDKRNYYQKHTFLYGFEISENKIESTTYNQHQNLNSAFFIQDSYNLNQKSKVGLALRFDHHEEYGSETSPKLSYLTKLNSHLNYYASIAKSYRAPSFSELYLPRTKMRSNYMIGNPDLKPEKAIAYETGFKYNNRGLKSEISIFKRDVEDLIDYKKISSNEKLKVNLNEAVFTGIEFKLSKRINSLFAAAFNYSYLDARTEDDQRLDDRPYSKAGLEFIYQQKDIISSLNFNYIGEKKDGAENIDSYVLTNWNLKKEIKADLALKLAINNLFDQDYTFNGKDERPGRNYNIAISKNF